MTLTHWNGLLLTADGAGPGLTEDPGRINFHVPKHSMSRTDRKADKEWLIEAERHTPCEDLQRACGRRTLPFRIRTLLTRIGAQR